MKNFVQVILALTVFSDWNSLHAQVAPSIEWQKCLGGSDEDLAFAVEQTSDGGFIVCGYSKSLDGDVSGNHGYEDYWIVKLDAGGNLEWQKSLGGSGFDFAFCIDQTSDDGFIVCGYSTSDDGDVSLNHGDTDYWIVKLDSGGNLMWQKSFGGSYDDYLVNSVQQTNDGGFIIAGSTNSNDGDVSGNHSASYDYWIIKLDTDGNLTWQKCLGGGSLEKAYSIQQTAEGDFIVAGSSNSSNGDVTGNNGQQDYWIARLDTVGNLIWQKSLGGSDYEEAFSIQQTIDGGFIVAGYSYSTDGDVSGNHGHEDYWIVKLDTEANIVWEKSLGGSSSDDAYSVQQTNDGGYVVAGLSYSDDGDISDNSGFEDYWIVKLNDAGDLIWQESIGGSGSDDAYCIRQTSDGGYIVAGLSYSNDGDVLGNHGFSDYWIVKLSSDITGISTPSAIAFSLYPNPVQNQLTLVLHSFSEGGIKLATSVNQVTIHVYDLQGRMQDCGLQISNFGLNNSIQLNTENLADGFYTIQIVNNKTGESEVGKFVKGE